MTSASVYIIRKARGGVKVGRSANPSSRRSSLQAATPDRLELIWSGEFSNAGEVERGAHALLAPWKISGEWFNCDPFLAGIAIEGAHTGSERIAQFLGRTAAAGDDIELDEKVEADFPDLYARLSFPRPEQWTDWTGKKHDLPHKKFTRVIVAGFPETTFGCPKAPWHKRIAS